ncbi:MAG: RNA polymerase sigma factor [Gammaproteobacteria bacterium]|nr:RNA polymerase sigma factor [Gammaproteobacteria bacterium]MDH5801133.1 RNA polymerase sigma factor [Gammaproteobacteria bacterium]
MNPIFFKKRVLEQIESRWDRMYRVAYAWTHDPHLSRDLVQETASRAIRKYKQLQDIQALDAWLFRILSNCWYDVCRQNKHLQELTDEHQLVDYRTPETDQYQNEVVRKVQSALTQLPLEQRQIITLIDLEGFSYSEVAEIVGVPIGTVMSRVCRARNKLKVVFETMDITSKPNAVKSSEHVRRIK